MVSVDLDTLEDRYYAGYGLGLSNEVSGQCFYVTMSSIAEFIDLSGKVIALKHEVDEKLDTSAYNNDVIEDAEGNSVNANLDVVRMTH